MVEAFTYKDLDLLLTMGANGFNLDHIHYNSGYAYIKMSRRESEDSTVRAILIQTEKNGLQIYECKS